MVAGLVVEVQVRYLSSLLEKVKLSVILDLPTGVPRSPFLPLAVNVAADGTKIWRGRVDKKSLVWYSFLVFAWGCQHPLLG